MRLAMRAALRTSDMLSPTLTVLRVFRLSPAQKGFTALHYCAKHGGPEVAKVLIAHGADILGKTKVRCGRGAHCLRSQG
jgi:ankyrin repeat protein